MQSSSILNILQHPQLALNCKTLDIVESRFSLYLKLLVKWNDKINLTAEKDPDSILKRHIFDSLHYSRVIKPSSRVMDIGSGAGFPGIPLKIIFPELNLVMVESQRKRCSFIETVARELGLDRTLVINDRSEDISPQYEKQFDAVIFRAVSGLQDCIAMGERFLNNEGTLIIKKPLDASHDQLESSLFLKDNIAITSYYGLVSSLLVFEKCFT
jgi:16S rRNA (guanine527-N7)-methyltransferase